MILGLDLSLTNTGWVILDEEGYVVNNGVIRSKYKNVERLDDIRTNLIEIIKKNNIEIAVIEGYAFSPNQGRSFSIGELGGIIKLELYNCAISYYIVAPTSLKKFATGKGNIPKSTIEKEIYKRWNVEFKTEHEVDAYVLARIGLHIYNNDKYKLTNWQINVLKTILEDKGKRNCVKEKR